MQGRAYKAKKRLNEAKSASGVVHPRQEIPGWDLEARVDARDVPELVRTWKLGEMDTVGTVLCHKCAASEHLRVSQVQVLVRGQMSNSTGKRIYGLVLSDSFRFLQVQLSLAGSYHGYSST